MYSFSAWKLPDWAGPGHLHKQLVRYLLKKTLGSFVKSDFAVDNLEFELTKGQLSLKSLELNAEFINELLPGIPIRVVSGDIRSIYISVPWQTLLSEPSEIRIEGLDLKVEVGVKATTKQEAHASFLEASTLSIATEFLSELHESTNSPSSVEDINSGVPSEAEAPHLIGGLIDKVLKSLKITIFELSISLVPTFNKESSILIQIMELAFSEDTSNEIDSTFQQNLLSRKIAFSGLSIKVASKEPSDIFLLKCTEESTLEFSYGSSVSNQEMNTTQAATFPSFFIKILLQPIEINLQPSEFAFLSEIVKSIFQKNSPESNASDHSKSSTLDFKTLDFRVDFFLAQLSLKIHYFSTKNFTSSSLKNSSHLKLDFQSIQMISGYYPETPIPFYNLSGTKEGELQANFQISKLTIEEWLSTQQFPTSIIPHNGVSFGRDCYNPILLPENNLPSSTFFEKLTFIGEKGRKLSSFSAPKFSGLSTFWCKAQQELDSMPQINDFSLFFKSDLCTISSIELEVVPLSLRFDPRLIDRLKGYILVFAQPEEARKGSEPKPNSQKETGYPDTNFPSGVDVMFDEFQMLHDLDARSRLLPKEFPLTWKIHAKTSFLRVIMLGPCDILGDSVEMNQTYARVHQDAWVMDIKQPWAAFPGPPPCSGGHFKLGYFGLDITLLSGIENTAHGILAVSPNLDQYPTLEIGRGSGIGGEGGISFLHSPTRIYNGRGFPVPFPSRFEGFNEGEVKATELSEKDDEVLSFKQSTVETSLFTINCNFPRVELHFNKNTYDRTQFLLNDISSWEPSFLKGVVDDSSKTNLRPCSPTESEGGASFYTARDGEQVQSTGNPILPPYLSSLDGPHLGQLTLPSLMSLVVCMPWLCIYLDASSQSESREATYSIIFTECRFFNTSKLHGKTQTYTHSEAEEVYLLDTTDSSKQNPIVSPLPCKTQELNCFMLSIFSSIEPPLTSIKDIAVALSLSNLDLHVSFNSEPPVFLKDLMWFFSGDSEVVTVSNTVLRSSITVDAQDVSIVLDSDELGLDASWVTVLINKAGASVTLFGPNIVTNIHSGIEKAQLFLSHKSPPLVPLLPKEMRLYSKEDSNENLSASQFWKSLQFTDIGTLKCLGCDLTYHNRVKNPLTLMYITNDYLILELCQDSLAALQKLSELWSKNTESSNKKLTELTNQIKQLGVLENPITYNILDTLDEDAYSFINHPNQPVATDGPDIVIIDEFFGESLADTELDPPSSITFTPLPSVPSVPPVPPIPPIPQSKKKISKKLYDNYLSISSNDFISAPNPDLEGEVKVLDVTFSEWIEDYFVQETLPFRKTSEIIDSSFDFVRFKAHLFEFKLVVKLYDGSDWYSELKDSPQTSPTMCNISYKVKLNRPLHPSIEIKLDNLEFDYCSFHPGKLNRAGSEEEDNLRLGISVGDVEIFDHIPTSTWGKFLSYLKPTSNQHPRECLSKMVNLELIQLRPTAGDPTLEYRLKVNVLPLRLFVDQDALNFLIDFFVKDPDQDPLSPSESQCPSNPPTDMYFQYVEVGTIKVVVDYKPKHLNLKQLREGNYAELAKVFHLEDSQLTLDCVKLNGVSGLAKLTDDLIGHWLPHITETQIPSVVSGVGPIRSLANISHGVADLILLPIQQYKKDGRIVKGVARGASSFARATTSEAVRVGTSLVMGAQVILEQADSFLKSPSDYLKTSSSDSLPDPEPGIVSKYAHQPSNLNEGMELAYQTLRRNIDTAARTVLAVPVEFSEQTGVQGSTRAVIKAIPIAVLQPMIGATQAISMALLGLRNSLDPLRLERLQDKYKTSKNNSSH